MKKYLLVLILALPACEVQPQQMVGPHGKKAYSMKCNGMGRSLQDCYKKAGEVCPKGYNIIDRSDQFGGFISNGAVNSPAHGVAYTSGTTTAIHNSLLAVECK